MKTYTVNEVYRSLQGEGMRAGTANVFVRFTGCNLRCDIKESHLSPGGFACDTEFASGRPWELEALVQWIIGEAGAVRAVIFTGGEPGLQLDAELMAALKDRGFYLAIETNGTIELPPGLDWIACSPKVAEHAVKQKFAHELRYVRAYGQGIPKPSCKAENLMISPAFSGLELDQRALAWCQKLVLENPAWRLSVQMHKFLSIR